MIVSFSESCNIKKAAHEVLQARCGQAVGGARPAARKVQRLAAARARGPHADSQSRELDSAAKRCARLRALCQQWPEGAGAVPWRADQLVQALRRDEKDPGWATALRGLRTRQAAQEASARAQEALAAVAATTRQERSARWHTWAIEEMSGGGRAVFSWVRGQAAGGGVVTEAGEAGYPAVTFSSGPAAQLRS